MQLWELSGYASERTAKLRLNVALDAFRSVFRYNISLKDYFCFRFFELGHAERNKWAGTGFMYEFQLKMNPEGAREVLENKVLFLKRYSKLNKRRFYALSEIEADLTIPEQLMSEPSGRIVIKGSRGQVGKEVEVITAGELTADGVLEFMKRKKLDLIEEYVVQHHLLMDLSPSGLNTVRIFTQLHNGEVDLLGARLRITVNSAVDNMAAGNLAAPVEITSGIVNGPGVYSDITKPDQHTHPVTGMAITGFVLPHWNEVIDMVKTAAMMMPENKSVGWDVAITEDGPELIEGNHNWCKLLWQMPVKRGLKKQLEKYL